MGERKYQAYHRMVPPPPPLVLPSTQSLYSEEDTSDSSSLFSHTVFSSSNVKKVVPSPMSMVLKVQHLASLKRLKNDVCSFVGIDQVVSSTDLADSDLAQENCQEVDNSSSLVDEAGSEECIENNFNQNIDNLIHHSSRQVGKRNLEDHCKTDAKILKNKKNNSNYSSSTTKRKHFELTKSRNLTEHSSVNKENYILINSSKNRENEKQHKIILNKDTNSTESKENANDYLSILKNIRQNYQEKKNNGEQLGHDSESATELSLVSFGDKAFECQSSGTLKEIQNFKDKRSWRGLSDWILCPLKNGRVCVEGKLSGDTESDERWKSTGIVQCFDRHTVVTSSGSMYKLIGPMKKALALEKGLSTEIIQKFQNGFPMQWKEIFSKYFPVKASGSLEVQEKTIIQNASKSRTLQQNKNSDVKHSQKKNKQKSSGDRNVKKKNIQKSDCKNLQRKAPTQKTLHQEQNASEKNTTQVSVDMILSGEMQVTRSGRRVLPRLAWWANEHVHSSPITEDIIYHSISPNHDISMLSTSLLKRCSGLRTSQQIKGHLNYNSNLQSKSEKSYMQETKKNIRLLNQSQEAQVQQMKQIDHDAVKDIDIASYSLKEEVMKSSKQYGLPKARLKSKTCYSLSKVAVQEVNKEKGTVNCVAVDYMSECQSNKSLLSNSQSRNIFHPVHEEDKNKNCSVISCECQTNQSKQMLSPVIEEINITEIDEAEPAFRQEEQESCQTNNMNEDRKIRVGRKNGLKQIKLSLSNVYVQLNKISDEKKYECELKEVLSDSGEENMGSSTCLSKESNDILACHKTDESNGVTITKSMCSETKDKQEMSKGERSRKSQVNKRNTIVDDSEGDAECDDEVSVTRTLRERPVNKRNTIVDDSEGDAECDDEISVIRILRERPVNKRNTIVDDSERDAKCDDEISARRILRGRPERNIIVDDSEGDAECDDEVSVTRTLRERPVNKRNTIVDDSEGGAKCDDEISARRILRGRPERNIIVDDSEGDAECDDEVSVTRTLRERPVNKRNTIVDDNEGNAKCDDEISVTRTLRERPVNKRNTIVDDSEGGAKCDDEISARRILRGRPERNIIVDDSEGDAECDDEVSVTRTLRKRPVNKRNTIVDDNEGNAKCDDEISVTRTLRKRPVNKRNTIVDDSEGDAECDDEVSVTRTLRGKPVNKQNVISVGNKTDERCDNSLSRPMFKKLNESKNGNVLVVGRQRGSVKEKDVATVSISCSENEDLSLIRKQRARSKSQCQYSNFNIPNDSGYNSTNGTSDYSSDTTINVFSKKDIPTRYQSCPSQTKPSSSFQLKKHDICEAKRQEALTLDFLYKSPAPGGKGTMKRKRQIYNILTQANEGYKEDLFDSSPFRNKKTKFSETIFDTFDELEDIPVMTPKFEVVKPSPLSPKKTPTYLDQDNLPVFNQMKNGINVYLFNREKWRKENTKNQKSKSSKTPVNYCKHDESRRRKFPEKLPQVLFKVTRSAETMEELEENDYYFSGSESDNELIYSNI
ncbi:uncharacterized protein LOC143248924 isoform X3 [Tachypleus tridentatus]|uniref:uncharacterized protein LOC143248924 isoform X3 n=1 Tax=Tachypleus tridentatus TaxID=6853 RepID=UPI003FD4A195